MMAVEAILGKSANITMRRSVSNVSTTKSVNNITKELANIIMEWTKTTML